MKVNASPPPSTVAPVEAPVAEVPVTQSIGPSPRPSPGGPGEGEHVPQVGSAKAPVGVAARLDGAAEKQLRTTLAQLKADVSPKTIALAVNKLATHARQDVREALKAMLGGDDGAVAKFVKTDHLDFARAELKAIAAKLPARVVETTERVVDLQMGVVAGMTPVPAPALFDHAFEYELGQRMGAAVGLAADAAAILVGSGMTGGGAAGAPVTAGASLAVSEAGLGLAAAGAVGAAFHGGRLMHPLPAPVYEARARERSALPKKVGEKHIFEGEVKDRIEKPTAVVKAERKRLSEEAKKRPLTSEEKKVFEDKVVRVAVGWHLESTGGKNARIIETTRSAPNALGVYTANVELLDPMTGEWVRKEAASTFFPAHYSKADVGRAIEEAYGTSVQRDGAWRGLSHSGIEMVLVIDEGDIVVTGYPLKESQ